ncbi:hypothetical protein E4U12_001507, partial [Claviceps purpurea]
MKRKRERTPQSAISLTPQLSAIPQSIGKFNESPTKEPSRPGHLSFFVPTLSAKGLK